MQEARQSLADCVFCIACQSNMSKVDVLGVMEMLAKNSELDSDGRLDEVTLTLLMSILYAVDVSILQAVEDSDGMYFFLSLDIKSILT